MECGAVFRPTRRDQYRCLKHGGSQYLRRRALGRRTGSTRAHRRRRVRIFERDGYRCQHCGTPVTPATGHLDHLVAVINGGSDEDSNLRTLCRTCNLAKGGR